MLSHNQWPDYTRSSGTSSDTYPSESTNLEDMEAEMEEQKWTYELMKSRITVMILELEEVQKIIEANIIHVDGIEKLLKKNVESLGGTIDNQDGSSLVGVPGLNPLEEKKRKFHNCIEDVFGNLMSMKKLYVSLNEQIIDRANKDAMPIVEHSEKNF